MIAVVRNEPRFFAGKLPQELITEDQSCSLLQV